MRTLRPEANYFSDPRKARHQRAGKGSWMSVFVAALMIATVFVFNLGLNPSAVFAAEDEDGFDSSALESTFKGADPDQLTKYMDEYSKGVKRNSFQYVLGRVFTPQYINHLPDAVVASNAQEQANRIGFNPNRGGAAEYICSTNQRGAGTPIYHNCDVPNFSAEFAQGLYSLFDRSGPQNAFTLNAASVLFPSFGQSKSIPGGSVPVETAGQPHKYTGLEVFGYELQLSSYYGEWDHIQTVTQSRLLTNYSFFDSINLTAQSIGNAIGGAFNVAGTMAASGWNTGGIFGAIGGFYSGLFQGGASGAMNTLLDTSDANVVLTFGWFRSNYSNTAYGLRELTNQEMAAQIRAGFLSYMNATMPKDMSYDKWLKDTAPGGDIMSTPPEPPIASCTVYTTPNGGEVVHGTAKDAPPGITPDRCDQLQDEADRAYFSERFVGTWTEEVGYNAGRIVYYAGSYYEAPRGANKSDTTPNINGDFRNVSGKIAGVGGSRGFDLGVPDKGDGRGGWDKDGARKAQSFNGWLEATKKRAGNWEGSLSEYGISLSAGACTPANAGAEEEAAARAAYSSWLANCWSPQWKEAAEDNERANQSNTNTSWLSSLLTGSVLAKWSANNPDAFDFNSPWKRYVCLKPNGTDVTDGVWASSYNGGDKGTPKLVSAFSSNGKVNSLCPRDEYRAPIQGGLFGDGYASSGANQNPGVDTRHISNYFGPGIAALHPFFLQPLTGITQMIFSIGQFATQLSNEIITWTYTPILESLGITDTVTDIIKSLRDGIFFQLAVLVIAAAGLYILYQAGVHRRYREMFISAVYLALIFILGAGLMLRAGDVVNLVDRGPANIEKALLSIVLAPSTDNDKLCAAGAIDPTSNDAEVNWSKFDLNAASKGGSLTDIFDKNYSAADDGLREVLCTNWKVFVYYPWAFAQWGVSPDQLNNSDMLNTNEELVGNAQVDLGGTNGKLNNWAVYQLKSMKLGSSTTIDWNLTSVNVKSKDFYKLVDMQAGPNNGAGTDSRFLQSWAGMDPFSRLGVSFMSTGVAVLGAVTVGAYSITKIVLSLITVLMLIFLPIVFLFGLFPTKRKFVKDYMLMLAGLIIQRLALMVMIAIFLLILMSILSTSQGYLGAFMGSLLICLVFLKFRKSVMKFTLASGGAATGGLGGFASKASAWTTGLVGLDGGKAAGKSWGQVGDAFGQMAPTDLKNLGSRTIAAGKNSVIGGVAGVVTGNGFKAGAERYAGQKDTMQQRKVRRAGWGAIQHVSETRQELIRRAQAEAAKDEKIKAALPELEAYLPVVRDYENQVAEHQKKLALLKQAVLNREVVEEPKLDEYGNNVLDENGKHVMSYQFVERTFDEETGDMVVTYKEVIPPEAPEAPKIERNQLSPKAIGVVRRYGELSNTRHQLVERKEKLQEELYVNGKSQSIVLDFPTNATREQAERIIDEMFPDSAGFTNVARSRLKGFAKELVSIDKEVMTLDEKMDKLNEEFNREYEAIGYKDNPLATHERVAQAINEQAKAEENKGS